MDGTDTPPWAHPGAELADRVGDLQDERRASAELVYLATPFNSKGQAVSRHKEATVALWGTVAAIAAAIQTAILAAAAFYAFTQVREAQRTRLLSVLIALRQDIDTTESRSNRYTLFNELPDDLTSPLPAEQDLVVDRVVREYENIARLIENGFIDFNLMADFYGNSAERSWRRVEPWIQKERARRNNTTYAPDLEKFAQKCIKHNAQKHGQELQTFRRGVNLPRSKQK